MVREAEIFDICFINVEALFGGEFVPVLCITSQIGCHGEEDGCGC